MTAANDLDLAKQGNPKAIAALMNQTLQSKGITTTVILSGSCLTVVAESDTVPDQAFLLDFIRQGIVSLKPKAIERLIVQGKAKSEKHPGWRESVELQAKPAIASTRQTPINVIRGSSKPHKVIAAMKWFLPLREYVNTLLLGAIFLAVLQGSWNINQTEPQFWEYQVVAVEDTTFDITMRRLGAEGWEIASARRALSGDESSRQGIYEIIFRRAITKDQDSRVSKLLEFEKWCQKSRTEIYDSLLLYC